MEQVQLKEIELDVWFFNLPAQWQEEITGIKLSDYGVTDENNGTYEADPYYEFFDNAVAGWWDNLNYEKKLSIYKNEEKI